MPELRKSNSNMTPAVILSGGTEVVSLSIAEALAAYNIPLVVISLGMKSMIRDIPPVFAYQEIQWPPKDTHQTVSQINTFIGKIKNTNSEKWPIFASEDGGLRFLIENRQNLSSQLLISDANKLKLDGLDKEDLLTYLKDHHHENLIAPTITLHKPQDIIHAFEVFGKDAIIKPSLKPLSMKVNMGNKGAKIFKVPSHENVTQIVERFSSVWHLSSKWVAQKRLNLSEEIVWWGCRFKNKQCVGLTAIERWKYPRVGGTACWVETKNVPQINDQAKTILDCIDYQGIAELPFLKDEHGHWRLIELNPRAWLQVALATKANFPLIHYAYCDLLNYPFNIDSSIIKIPLVKSWVNIERLLLAALSGEQGNRLQAVNSAFKIIQKSDCNIVYNTPFSKIKRRWLTRMLQKII